MIICKANQFYDIGGGFFWSEIELILVYRFSLNRFFLLEQIMSFLTQAYKLSFLKLFKLGITL